jgi:Tol biopolymer transport system component
MVSPEAGNPLGGGMGEQMQRVASRQAGLALLVAGAAWTGLGCGGEDVTNPPATGSLTITTSTTGPEPDADGYAVSINDGAETAIPASGTLQRDNLEPGNHTIRLTGMAAHCTVAGENPRSVSLPAGETVTVTFQLTCSSTTGTLVVSSSSSGFFPDPDGYLITVDGESRGALGGSAQQTLDNVPTGVHQIGLSGLIANCRVQGENPRPQEIVGGASALVAFEVECAPPAIAFASNRGSDWSMSIHLMNPDGSGLVRIPSDRDERSPIWSPDGRRLAFISSSDLYVLTPGAGDRTRLFRGVSASGRMVHWSPDGTMLAVVVQFDSLCGGLLCIRHQLWKVNADGTGLRKLAGGMGPAWSPDGRTIAFANDQGIATIEPDGGGLKQFTVPLLGQPEEATWSPDGSRLAFSAFVSSNPYANAIFTIKPDGTGLVRLTPAGGSDWGPKWSPDGSRIAFRMEVNPVGRSGLAVMNADGSGRSIVSDLEIKNLDFTWSPDGGRLAFTVRTDFEIGDDDVYVVNVDGSGLRNLTRNPRADMQPSWGFR